LGRAYGNKTFVFNGGTVVATTSTNAFMHDLTQAYVAAGGANLDTAGFDIVIPQPLKAHPDSQGGGLTKTGNGVLALTGANTYTGRTVLQQGTLQLGPAAHNTVLSLGGADIQAGKMLFDYTGGSSPAATIQTLLAASYNGGQWDTGQFLCTTADAGHGLGWIDDTGVQQVIVRYALYGDADLSGIVDSDDLFILLSGLGSTSAVWSDGDFDYNGIVNSDDLFTLLSALGSSLQSLTLFYNGALDSASLGMLSAHGVTVVPEPATLGLLICAASALAAACWQRRQQIKAK